MIIVNLTNREVFMKNSGNLTIVIIMLLSFGCAKNGSDQAIIAKDVEQNIIAKEVWSETVTGMKFCKILRKSMFSKSAVRPRSGGVRTTKNSTHLQLENIRLLKLK